VSGQPSQPTQAFDLVTADVNKDGNVDPVTGGTFGIQTLLGDGQGGFTLQAVKAACRGTSCPMDISLVDFDQDGNLDLLVVLNQMIGVGADPPIIGVMTGSSSGNFGAFEPVATLPRESGVMQAFAGDLDGNGRPDIAFSAVQTPGAELRVIMNTASGFWPPQTVRLPYQGTLSNGGVAQSLADENRELRLRE
jgi:hypothetical protein